MPPSSTPRRFQRDMSAAEELRRFEVGAPDDHERLDRFLSRRLPWRSRDSLQALIRDGSVELRAHKRPWLGLPQRTRPGQRVHRGQEVVVRLPAAFAEEAASGERQAQVATASCGEIAVLHDDAFLLAVNKPPAVSLYPTRRHRSGSLVERVHRQRRTGARRDRWPPSPCHRLDRDTSGVVLFAKDAVTRGAIGALFERGRIEKRYLALVRGLPAAESGRIDLPLGPALHSAVALRRGVRDDPAGRPALTLWRCLLRYEDCSLLELRPRTGRPHQLRAHLAALGHPILGDRLYLGGDELFLRSLERELTADDRALLGHSRLALHAWQLSFEHPRREEAVIIEAPLWLDREPVMQR